MSEDMEAKRQTLEKLSKQMVTALFVDSTMDIQRVAKGFYLLEPETQIFGLPKTGNYIHFVDGQIYEIHLDSISRICPYQGFEGGQIIINEPLMRALQRKQNGT